MPGTDASDMPSIDITSFAAHLAKSRRIVALLGAGLSASSGLPTFRGAGGLWRNYDAISLASPNAFRNDPGLVWQFYSYRRHMALNAKPNPAHLALAELARRKPNFLTLSQNVDNLSPRAGHPADQLKLLHGNLFDVKCWDEHRCGYSRKNDYSDPIVPALALPEDQAAVDAILQRHQNTSNMTVNEPLLEKHIAKKGASISASDTPDSEAAGELQQPISASETNKALPAGHPLIRGLDIASADIPISTINRSELPQCPACKKNLLRPGVVWFGESLPQDTMADVDAYFSDESRIDLMLVIGTSSKVWPAAGYTRFAKQKGARVAVINMDPGDKGLLDADDFFFEGDAAKIVPEILKGVIGEVGTFNEKDDPVFRARAEQSMSKKESSI